MPKYILGADIGCSSFLDLARHASHPARSDIADPGQCNAYHACCRLETGERDGGKAEECIYSSAGRRPILLLALTAADSRGFCPALVRRVSQRSACSSLLQRRHDLSALNARSRLAVGNSFPYSPLHFLQPTWSGSDEPDFTPHHLTHIILNRCDCADGIFDRAGGMSVYRHSRATRGVDNNSQRHRQWKNSSLDDYTTQLATGEGLMRTFSTA
jgi:hypothetical protein